MNNKSLTERWVELNRILKKNPEYKLFPSVYQSYDRLVSDCKAFFEPYRNSRRVRLPFRRWKAYDGMYKACHREYKIYKKFTNS